MNLWQRVRFGELSPEYADVGLCEDGKGDVIDEEQEVDDPVTSSGQPVTGEVSSSGQLVGQSGTWEVLSSGQPVQSVHQPVASSSAGGQDVVAEIQAQRLIINKDARYPGEFSRFFGCNWETGQIYPFNENQDKLPREIPPSPLCSPTTKMKQQVSLGFESMKSTYRLLSTFEDPSGKIMHSKGTAFALSRHVLLTAAHMLILVTTDENGTRMYWKLKTIQALAGEYVHYGKLSQCGLQCMPLGTPVSLWGTKSECPPSGSDIAFLKVEEELPCFLLPCSPLLATTLVTSGYPGALEYLRKAARELKQDVLVREEGTVWSTYWSVLWDRIRQWAVESKGDLGNAEKQAKQWLLEQFQTILRGIPEGVQTMSAGSIESITSAYIGHTCPTLPGLSGAPISPLEVPGYFVAAHSGALEINQNIGTSTDNWTFVRQYMEYVVQDLPGPDWPLYQRAYFTVEPFLSWLRKYPMLVPPSSTWAPYLGPTLERPSKKRKLEL